MLNAAILLLGSNLGNRKYFLHNAIIALKNLGNIVSSSSIYETDAWGKTDQGAFLNQVISIETKYDPFDLMKEILLIEQQLGRKRLEHWGARIIDIDILYYNNLIIEDDNLKIPHPQIQFRKFTLVPLNELMPNFVHPILLKEQHQLLDECLDICNVRLYNEN